MLKKTLTEFLGDECPRMAAALSYYTVISLPSLLVLVLAVVRPFVNPQRVEGFIARQAGSLLGANAAAQIVAVVRNMAAPGGGVLETGLGVLLLVFAATAGFSQLQSALNTAWNVEPNEESALGEVKSFVVKRVISFLMVLAISLFLLLSLIVGAGITAFGNVLEQLLPPTLGGILLRSLDTGVSFLVATGLFALVFRVLPDARIRWRDVLVGATGTAALFVAGKYSVSLYLAHASPASAYGAAGSLAVVLIGIYLFSLILLLGAEFTQVWAQRHGPGIQPEAGAIRVVWRKQHLPPSQPDALPAS